MEEETGLKYEKEVADKIKNWFSEVEIPSTIGRRMWYNGTSDVDIWVKYRKTESFIEVKTSGVKVITEEDGPSLPPELKEFEPKFKRIETKAKNPLAKERGNLDSSRGYTKQLKNYKEKEPDHIGFLTKGRLMDKNSKPRQVIRCRVGYTLATFVSESNLGELLSDILFLEDYYEEVKSKYFNKSFEPFKLEDIVKAEATSA